MVPGGRRYRSRRWVRREIAVELPLWVDLLRFSIEAGSSVSQAVEVSSRHLRGPLREHVDRVLDEWRSGLRLSEALERLAERERSTIALVEVMLATERYGTPIAVGLERLAHESRAARLRLAEQAGKRLSIVVVLPVAGCFLPAFALLTVVPLIVSFVSGLTSAFQ